MAAVGAPVSTILSGWYCAVPSVTLPLSPVVLMLTEPPSARSMMLQSLFIGTSQVSMYELNDGCSTCLLAV